MKNYFFLKPDPELKNNLMAFGFEIGSGWLPLLEETFDKIEYIILEHYPEVKDDFQVLQVKEKYGELRIYVSHNFPEIEDIMDNATLQSINICEHCGKPGEIIRVGNWYYTRCPECAKKI